MVNWPEELVSDIARRRCVIVVGSGVSAQAIGDGGMRPPTWKDFLIQTNNECVDGPLEHVSKAIEEGDLLHACEWLQRKYDHRWTNQLRNKFSTPKFQPAEVHRTIAKLDSRVVFSLNFDDILQRSMAEVHAGSCVKKQYYDSDVSEFLRGTDRYIINVHGSLDTPNRIIFTQNQYAQARIDASRFYNAFDSALMNFTFLFIGTGITDPDVNLILENQNFTYAESHPHYFLATKGMHPDLRESLRANRNLEIIEYEKVDEQYSGFVNAIDDLYKLIDPKREDIAEYSSW